MANSVNLDISQQLDITCRRGDTFSLTLTFTDANGDAIDLGSDPTAVNSTANYDFSIDVRDSDTDDGNNAILSTDSASVASGEAQQLTISRVAADGSDGKIKIEGTASVMGAVLGGSYVYDLQAEYLTADGTVSRIETWLFGAFIVNEDVTIDVGA